MNEILGDAVITANQILIMFFLILVGVVLYKTKLISDEGNKSMTNIALYVAISAVVIDSYQMPFDKTIAINLLWTLLLATVSHFLLILISTLLFKKKNEEYRVLRFATVFGNCSFMGIPLLSAIIPGTGVIYATAYITVFNILLWTYGVIISDKTGEKLSLKKIILSPVILSVFVGLVLFLFSIKLWSPLGTAVSYVGSLNTPLAMIITGVSVAKSNILSAFRKKDIYIVSFIKLILVSLIMSVIMRFMPFLSEEIKLAVIVLSGVPTAATSIMFAGKYGNNDIYAVEILVLTTVLSLITLPLSVFLGMLICG